GSRRTLLRRPLPKQLLDSCAQSPACLRWCRLVTAKRSGGTSSSARSVVKQPHGKIGVRILLSGNLLSEDPANKFRLNRFAAAGVRARMIDHDHQHVSATRCSVDETCERADVVDAAGLQTNASVHAWR